VLQLAVVLVGPVRRGGLGAGLAIGLGGGAIGLVIGVAALAQIAEQRGGLLGIVRRDPDIERQEAAADRTEQARVVLGADHDADAAGGEHRSDQGGVGGVGAGSDADAATHGSCLSMAATRSAEAAMSRGPARGSALTAGPTHGARPGEALLTYISG
jgi:hypothetical protein